MVNLSVATGSPDLCVLSYVLLLHATHPWTINGTSVPAFDFHKQPDNDLLQFWLDVAQFVFQSCCSHTLKKKSEILESWLGAKHTEATHNRKACGLCHFFPPSCFVVSFWGWSWMRKIVTCGKSQVLGRLPLFSSCPVDAGSIGTGLTLSPWIKRRLPQLCEKKSLVLHFDCGNFCWLNMEAKLQDEGGEKDQDIASVYILWTCTVWGRCLFVAFVISIINMENRWKKSCFDTHSCTEFVHVPCLHCGLSLIEWLSF